MDIYYHHVGAAGSAEDFPKTVFGARPISVVREHVPDSWPHKAELLRRLEAHFPEGEFNCWGVPAGALNFIRRMRAGDVVLLLETAGPPGDAPAMGEVIAFWPEQLPMLSEALWGLPRFPYIFFFRTERLSGLTWSRMHADFEYTNYDPPSRIFRVRKELAAYGGRERYVAHLRKHFGVEGGGPGRVTAAEAARELGVGGRDYQREVEKESSAIRRKSMSPSPQLTEGAGKRVKTVTERPRSAAFRIGIKQLYGFKCAICGTGLIAPDRKPAVESAHIFPKEHDGSDDYRNGVCLCLMHHWAFDAGWLAITDDHRVIVHDDLPAGGEYDFIRRYAGEAIDLPAQSEFIPHPLFLRAHRELKGFE
jgi:putative restriction endonuclease